MFDIITFGSATGDIFARLQGPRNKDLKNGSGFCFQPGEKRDIEKGLVLSGGGGTNTAASFANLGLKTAYIGAVGNDIFADLILADLKKRKVATKFMTRLKQKSTSFSVILTPESRSKERVILSHWGAGISLEKLPLVKAKWFYLAPLHQEAMSILEPLLEFAKKNKIKTAFNPSKEHILKTKGFFPEVDVLLLNQEEAGLFETERTAKIVCVTQGSEGCFVSQNGRTFKAKANASVRVMEKTGAGDAFGSGFVAGLFLRNDVEYAMRLGLANSEGCIQKIGAKEGLLAKPGLKNLPHYPIL